MEFKERLKKFRKESKMTQKEFADKCGFSRTTITELESGKKKATLKIIKRIAENTNTSISDWLNDEISVNKFDGLELVIEKLIKSGDINSEGSMNDKAKTLIFKMLEAEIKLLIQEKKN